MNTVRNTKQGFTIIEVVLVLAIAALIFLMVFIALPALQRGQRDTQREADLSRLQSQLNNYQANNRGAIPSGSFTATSPATTWGAFVDRYMKAGGDAFVDPNGTDYTLTSSDVTTFADSPRNIQVATGQRCNGEALQPAGARNVAFRMALEGGGIACVNN